MIDFAKLAAPFDPEKISWRVGSTTADKKKGMALAYVDARDVMARLDEVCGPGGWQCRYPHAGQKTVCEIGINLTANDWQSVSHAAIDPIGVQWVWKSDGAGDTDFEADKGALSDAFKRAAVRWGIGRYLYDMAAPWVAIEPAGKSFKIVASEMGNLRRLLSGVPSGPTATQSEVITGKKLTAAEWQDKAKALLAEAQKAETPEALMKWQMTNDAAINEIRSRSRPLVDWLMEGCVKHHDRLIGAMV